MLTARCGTLVKEDASYSRKIRLSTLYMEHGFLAGAGAAGNGCAQAR